jgi:hypothetical protein
MVFKAAGQHRISGGLKFGENALGTDPHLFAGLPGGSEIIEWFGFCPSFHDSALNSLELKGGSATLRIRAFRMTAEVDASGHYMLDRHAHISFELSGVTGIALRGDAESILDELTITRVETVAADWPMCVGPQVGDFELNFTTNIGLEGVMFAKEIKMLLEPSNPPA